MNGMGNETVLLSRLIDSINTGDVLYDIGASLGIHTVFMAKKTGLSGKVLAFEPECQSYEALKKNIQLNGLTNTFLFNVALGREFGNGTLASKGGTGDFSLLSDRGNGNGAQVPIVCGDTFVLQNALPFPNVVKIDVEGYELYVIEGLENTLRRSECRMVCCEIHPKLLPSSVSLDEFFELLRRYGFAQIESHMRGNTIHAFCSKAI
jgi:FkbM family methyltransferase